MIILNGRIERLTGDASQGSSKLDSAPGLYVWDNITVLCSNNHAEIDYAVIRVDESTYELRYVFADGSDEQLYVDSDHELDVKILGVTTQNRRSSGSIRCARAVIYRYVFYPWLRYV